MKRKMWKKMAAVFLAASMVMSLGACGTQKEENAPASDVAASSQEGTKAQTETKEEKTEEAGGEAKSDFVHDANLNDVNSDDPVCKDTVELTIGIVQDTNVEDYETNHFTKMLEEAANIKINFYYFPSSEYTQKLELMCAAGGDDLPDIVMMTLPDAVVSKYGNDGMFIPLEDYYENSSRYYKEGFQRVLDTEGADLMEAIRSSDGHIYTVPQYNETTTNPCYARIWMYQPWLEKLGLDVPTTTEEFKAVLEAFKTQDPNGNGKADEIPALGSDIMPAATQGSWFWEAMMNAFVPTTSRNNYLNADNGKISVPYTTEEWKEGIKYIRSLCEEGLFDPVSFTQDEATFKSLLNVEGDQLVGCFCFMSDSGVTAAHPSKNHWILVGPLTGPDGVCSTSYLPDMAVNKAYITKNCKNPEAAFRVLDLLGREDFTISTRWGKQGENWDYVADIKDDPEYKDHDFSQTFAGYPAYIYVMKNIWKQPNNNDWQNATNSFRTAEIAAGYWAADLKEGTANYELAQKLSLYEAVRTKEPIGKIPYTNDELAEATEISSSLNTYVKEKIALWCTGASDVDADWDNYLRELEGIGLSRYLTITQEAYDRLK